METGREDNETQGEAEKIVMLHNSKEESAKSFQEKQMGNWRDMLGKCRSRASHHV